MLVRELIEMLENVDGDTKIKMVNMFGKGSKNTYSLESECSPVVDKETVWLSVDSEGNRQGQPPIEAYEEWGY